jgi:hypothetical protein
VLLGFDLIVMGARCGASRVPLRRYRAARGSRGLWRVFGRVAPCKNYKRAMEKRKTPPLWASSIRCVNNQITNRIISRLSGSQIFSHA